MSTDGSNISTTAVSPEVSICMMEHLYVKETSMSLTNSAYTGEEKIGQNDFVPSMTKKQGIK